MDEQTKEDLFDRAIEANKEATEMLNALADAISAGDGGNPLVAVLREQAEEASSRARQACLELDILGLRKN